MWTAMTNHELGHAPSVLVVDDEMPIRRVARHFLEEAGCRVIEADCGEEAILALAEGQPVDLLLADLHMPGLRGDEMVRRIRISRPDLKVLYLTGRIDTLMDTRPLFESEAFLEKPFNGAGLREAVSLLLYETLTGLTTAQSETASAADTCASPECRLEDPAGPLLAGRS
jgi:CheY-like chemotaxis protein